MKKVKLYGKRGNGKFLIVDDEDFLKINKNHWKVDRYGYARRSLTLRNSKNGIFKGLLVHRLILNAPKGIEVDHINHDLLDNSW